jgi:hypothetical protein
MKKPLLPLIGAAVIKYEASFEISENGLREMKKVVVGVNDTGDDRTNQADAILTATLKLDDEGIKHWSIKGCVKVTS